MKKLLSSPSHPLKFILSIVLFFSGSILYAQTAQVLIPKGGFKIDGALRANVTTAAGDWAPRLNSQVFNLAPGAVDSFVIDANGNLKDSVTTWLQRDRFNSTLDNIFTNGSKFDDQIGSLRWGTGSAPSKNDIHNGVFHASGDADDNQWVFIGGDRLSTSGTSYIDFEFLQGTVTTNNNGTFTGSGQYGGRTLFDINVSMEYNNGGTAPKVVIYRWVAASESTGFWDSTGSAAVTEIYAKTNLATVDAPFGAFGNSTYAPFAFVESAINITQLLEIVGGANCGGLSIKTLWIKTKASSSTTAALKDFITPISLDLNFGGVSIDQKGPVCAGTANITLTGEPVGGTFSGNPYISGNIFNVTDAGVGSHRVIYTASAGVGCEKKDTMWIVVRALPTASISGTNQVCKDATSPYVVITGAGGTKPYTFSYNINGGGTLQRSTTGTFDTVRISVPTTAAGTFVYNLLSVQESSSTTCGQNQTGNATVTVHPLPTADAGTAPASQCYNAAGNIFALNGSQTNGNPVWSVQSKSNNALTVGFSNANVLNPNVTVGGSSLGGTVTLLLTVNSTTSPSCGSATSTVTVTLSGQNAGPDVVYTAPLCDQNTFSITVNGLQQNDIVTVKDKNGAAIAGLSPASPYNVPAATTSKTFTGIPAGSGYQVTLSRGGCISSPTICGTPAGDMNTSNITQEATARALGSATLESIVIVKAMPNPFSNQVRFMITNEEAGNGVLDIYNMAGQKIKTVYNGHIPAGTSYFDLKLATQSRGNLVYILKIGERKITGNLVQLSTN